MSEEQMRVQINEALEKLREAQEAVDNLGNSSDIIALMEENDQELGEFTTPIEDVIAELEDVRDSIGG